jgi:hypothetical protein
VTGRTEQEPSSIVGLLMLHGMKAQRAHAATEHLLGWLGERPGLVEAFWGAAGVDREDTEQPIGADDWTGQDPDGPTFADEWGSR